MTLPEVSTSNKILFKKIKKTMYRIWTGPERSGSMRLSDFKTVGIYKW